MWTRRIYYEHTHVDVDTKDAWTAAPDEGVQVVVELCADAPVRWDCDGKVVRDRKLWTGDDEYDPWGWGVKYGKLISDEEYFEIWRRACND